MSDAGKDVPQKPVEQGPCSSGILNRCLKQWRYKADSARCLQKLIYTVPGASGPPSEVCVVGDRGALPAAYLPQVPQMMRGVTGFIGPSGQAVWCVVPGRPCHGLWFASRMASGGGCLVVDIQLPQLHVPHATPCHSVGLLSDNLSLIVTCAP
jgi:hypothetical protein